MKSDHLGENSSRLQAVPPLTLSLLGINYAKVRRLSSVTVYIIIEKIYLDMNNFSQLDTVYRWKTLLLSIK